MAFTRFYKVSNAVEEGLNIPTDTTVFSDRLNLFKNKKTGRNVLQKFETAKEKQKGEIYKNKRQNNVDPQKILLAKTKP